MYGRDDVFEFSFSGLTDRLIARRGLEACGLEVKEESILAFLSEYEALIVQYRSENERADILPGVIDFLDALSLHEHIAVGIGTGNTEVGASVKLGWVGLGDRFKFGGYGNDHEDRGQLIRMGAERGARTLGVDLADCRIVIIGDSELDVFAAHAVGGTCLAVSTGWTSEEELRKAGCDFLVQGLTDPAALDFILKDS